MSQSSQRPVAALAAAGLAMLLIGCAGPQTTPSVPSETANGSVDGVAPSVPPSPSPTSVATASPSPPGDAALVDLGRELDIGVLGREHTDDLLEFASDGSAIWFSSGVAPDVESADGAPDLWRLEPFGDAELIWKNPMRDHTLVRIGGDLGTVAFVDMPLSGEREWTLYLIPRPGDDPIVLDRHPGDTDVPSFVPSFSVYERRIVWTSFDAGPDGPVSQLLTAGDPDWEPRLMLEYPADEVELWLPSHNGLHLAFTEVRYNEDRSRDERSVWLITMDDVAGRKRLDASGRATMPVVIPDAVLWKEADAGYNMFNWGRMFRYDIATEEVTEVDLGPQDYVNYPTGGQRFAAWWGNDSLAFGVYDHVAGESRMIERHRPGSDTGVLRPHIADRLLAWMRVVGSDADAWGELRYAWMPDAAELRKR